MPRIKLYAEGDRIKFDSQVLIESAHGIGSRLRLHLGENSDQLDASHVKTTGFRIRLFAPFGMSSQSFQHVLKGGDYVRLYHQECNAMLEVARKDDDGMSHGRGKDIDGADGQKQPRSSAGSSEDSRTTNRRGRRESNTNIARSPLLVSNPWGTEDSFLSEDNTLCLRELPEGSSPVDAKNASSLWQIELIQTQNGTGQGGRPITWDDTIRLKNVLSEGYVHIFVCCTCFFFFGLPLDFFWFFYYIYIFFWVKLYYFFSLNYMSTCKFLC